MAMVMPPQNNVPGNLPAGNPVGTTYGSRNHFQAQPTILKELVDSKVSQIFCWGLSVINSFSKFLEESAANDYPKNPSNLSKQYGPQTIKITVTSTIPQAIPKGAEGRKELPVVPIIPHPSAPVDLNEMENMSPPIPAARLLNTFPRISPPRLPSSPSPTTQYGGPTAEESDCPPEFTSNKPLLCTVPTPVHPSVLQDPIVKKAYRHATTGTLNSEDSDGFVEVVLSEPEEIKNGPAAGFVPISKGRGRSDSTGSITSGSDTELPGLPKPPISGKESPSFNGKKSPSLALSGSDWEEIEEEIEEETPKTIALPSQPIYPSNSFGELPNTTAVKGTIKKTENTETGIIIKTIEEDEISDPEVKSKTQPPVRLKDVPKAIFVAKKELPSGIRAPQVTVARLSNDRYAKFAVELLKEQIYMDDLKHRACFEGKNLKDRGVIVYIRSALTDAVFAKRCNEPKWDLSLIDLVKNFVEENKPDVLTLHTFVCEKVANDQINFDRISAKHDFIKSDEVQPKRILGERHTTEEFMDGFSTVFRKENNRQYVAKVNEDIRGIRSFLVSLTVSEKDKMGMKPNKTELEIQGQD